MTTSTSLENKETKNKMSSNDLELSTLVGREVLVLSNFFKNNSLYSKVVMVHDNIISLDWGPENDEITQLKNDQEIIVQFDYKGQRLSAKAKLFKTASGRHNIILNETVVPLSRRMFKRYKCNCQVRCAVFPIQRIVESNISKLRWLQVEALNISSGGILLPIPSKITDNTYLLLNIDIENPFLPNLVIGQVKHAHSINNFNYQVGTQFIIHENKDNHFSSLTLKKIPSKAFEYTIKTRNLFDKFLLKNLSKREE